MIYFDPILDSKSPRFDEKQVVNVMSKAMTSWKNVDFLVNFWLLALPVAACCAYEAAIVYKMVAPFPFGYGRPISLFFLPNFPIK